MKQVAVFLIAFLAIAGFVTANPSNGTETESRRAAISTARYAASNAQPQLRSSLLATLAERAAEAGLTDETVSLAGEALAALREASARGKATEVFYVCIRMARIDAMDLTAVRYLPACLDEADEYILQDVPDNRDASFWPYLHVRLAEELGALALIEERERLTAFAVDHVWPQFDGNERAAYGRVFVPILLEVQGAARATEYCNQIFGAAQIGAINTTDPVYPILISSFDCFAGLPEGLRTDVDQAFNHALENAQEEHGRATSIDALLMAASFQAYHGLDYPLRWETLPQLHQTEGCAVGDVPPCVLHYVLEHMQAAPLSADDLDWTAQLFPLALVTGTPEQIDQAETALRSAYRLTLEQPQYQGQFASPGYTSELMVQANISWTMARWGHAEAGAEVFEAAGPVQPGAILYEINVALDLADALIDEAGTERAMEFLAAVLPWEEDASLLFETGMESSSPLWTDHIRLARFYDHAGRHDLARAVLSNAVAAARSADAKLALGQAQMFLGYEGDAQDSFALAIDLAEVAEAEGAPFFMPVSEVRAIAAVSRIAPVDQVYREVPGFPWVESNHHWFFSATIPY